MDQNVCILVELKIIKKWDINPFWSSMGALIRENVCRSSWRLELHILFEGLSDSDYQWPGPVGDLAPLMETWRDPEELVVCFEFYCDN